MSDIPAPYGHEWGIRWDVDRTEEGYDREEWYPSELVARGIHGMYRASCVLIRRPLYRGVTEVVTTEQSFPSEHRGLLPK